MPLTPDQRARLTPEERKRQTIKDSFRLAINKSKTREEARRLVRLRGKFLSGNLSETDAMLGWMDLTLGFDHTKVRKVVA